MYSLSCSSTSVEITLSYCSSILEHASHDASALFLNNHTEERQRQFLWDCAIDTCF